MPEHFLPPTGRSCLRYCKRPTVSLTIDQSIVKLVGIVIDCHVAETKKKNNKKQQQQNCKITLANLTDVCCYNQIHVANTTLLPITTGNRQCAMRMTPVTETSKVTKTNFTQKFKVAQDYATASTTSHKPADR